MDGKMFHTEPDFSWKDEYNTMTFDYIKGQDIIDFKENNETHFLKISVNSIYEYWTLKSIVQGREQKIIDKIKKGDHIIFICKVSKVINKNNLKPLIYFNSKYF